MELNKETKFFIECNDEEMKTLISAVENYITGCGGNLAKKIQICSMLNELQRVYDLDRKGNGINVKDEGPVKYQGVFKTVEYFNHQPHWIVVQDDTLVHYSFYEKSKDRGKRAYRNEYHVKMTECDNKPCLLGRKDGCNSKSEVVFFLVDDGNVLKESGSWERYIKQVDCDISKTIETLEECFKAWENDEFFF